MGDGRKWAAEQDEFERDARRLKRFDETNPLVLLALFDAIKTELDRLNLDNVPMTAIGHERARELKKKIGELP